MILSCNCRNTSESIPGLCLKAFMITQAADSDFFPFCSLYSAYLLKTAHIYTSPFGFSHLSHYIDGGGGSCFSSLTWSSSLSFTLLFLIKWHRPQCLRCFRGKRLKVVLLHGSSLCSMCYFIPSGQTCSVYDSWSPVQDLRCVIYILDSLIKMYLLLFGP